LIQSVRCSPAFNYKHERLFYEARLSFDEGREPSKCFATDGSKVGNKPFVGFSSIDISDCISWKLRIAKIASTFTAETLAIGETQEILGKVKSEQNFMIFFDSESMLKRISISTTMNNTSHIVKMLKHKIEGQESRGKKCNSTGCRGTV
jgi:hypothetical protein